jgi:hypothetical protein
MLQQRREKRTARQAVQHATTSKASVEAKAKKKEFVPLCRIESTARHK